MGAVPHAVHDDGPVDDDEFLYRRLSYGHLGDLIAVDQNSGASRPSSAAFKPNPKRDPDGLSVYREQVLTKHGLDASAVQNDVRDVIASLNAAQPRVLVLDVVADPQPDDAISATPARARAHALITGWPTSKSQVSRLAKNLAVAATIILGG